MTRHVLLATFIVIVTAAVTPAAILTQPPTEIKGEAILKHPIGMLAMKAAELLAAGKIEETVALESKPSQEEWKKESAADRKELAERRRTRAPTPTDFAEAIRRSGVLTIEGDRAGIEATTASGEIRAMFEREAGQWRLLLAPMILGGGPRPTNETKLEGDAILQHPIGALVLRYADVVQSGKRDEIMRLASSEAQAKWNALPAGERNEDFAYRRRQIPSRADLTAGIRAGGVLFVGDDTRATLNVVRTEQKSSKPGEVTSTSTTLMIPVHQGER